LPKTIALQRKISSASRGRTAHQTEAGLVDELLRVQTAATVLRCNLCSRVPMIVDQLLG
jgi:hypothetical protein